jgi:hypothetical protein
MQTLGVTKGLLCLFSRDQSASEHMKQLKKSIRVSIGQIGVYLNDLTLQYCDEAKARLQDDYNRRLLTQKPSIAALFLWENEQVPQEIAAALPENEFQILVFRLVAETQQSRQGDRESFRTFLLEQKSSENSIGAVVWLLLALLNGHE